LPPGLVSGAPGKCAALPGVKARLRRRLTTLAAPGSPGPYYAYCPLRPGTASAARGTRASRQQPADELGVDPLDDLVCRGEPLARRARDDGERHSSTGEAHGLAQRLGDRRPVGDGRAVAVDPLSDELRDARIAGTEAHLGDRVLGVPREALVVVLVRDRPAV